MKKTLIVSLATALAMMCAYTSRATSSAILTDETINTPTPGPNDQTMMNLSGDTEPTGLNYYVDNGSPPGQIFLTGTNANGFSLRSLSIVSGGGSGGGITSPQYWVMYLYQYNPANSNMVQIAAYQSQPGFTFFSGDWLTWDTFGSSVGLMPNTHYAFSIHRGEEGWEQLGANSGDQYDPATDPYPGSCQVCVIPVNGGTLGTGNFSTTPGYDANMDVGLDVVTNLIINPPALAPAAVVAVGTPVTLTAGNAFGPGPYNYQWQTDGGSGNTPTNIPGATTTSYTPSTAATGLYQYDVYVYNGSSQFATSSVVGLTVTLATGTAQLTDVGAGPVSGPNDILQLSGGGDGDGLNYYDNNSSGPGQTFTTGNNANGYTLTALAVKTYGNSGSIATPGQYYLHIYNVYNGTNTVLLQDYTNTPLTVINASGDWVQWTGLSTVLAANKQYAYCFQNLGGYTGNNNAYGYIGLDSSTNAITPYAGGQMCQILPGGGTIYPGTNANGGVQSGVFDIGLTPNGVTYTNVFVNPIVATPSTPVLAGTTVNLSEDALGQATLHYIWQTDNGGATFSNIPGNDQSNLVVNTTGWAPGNYHYKVTVTNSVPSSGTSAVVDVVIYAVDTTAVLSDFGATAPVPGMYDVSQLTEGAVIPNGKPDGLNYYFDNSVPPGETFLTPSANAAGYTLNSLALQLSGDSGGGLTNGNPGQVFYLRIYTVNTNTSEATLYAKYTSEVFSNIVTGVTDTDWFKWTGMSLNLAANTEYAYTFGRDLITGFGYANLANVTGNLYPGGQVCTIPSFGGAITYGASGSFNGTFDIGLAQATIPVSLSIQRVGANLQVNYTGGLLLQATSLAGPWTTNSTATPVPITPSAAKMFYRVLKN